MISRHTKQPSAISISDLPFLNDINHQSRPKTANNTINFNLNTSKILLRNKIKPVRSHISANKPSNEFKSRFKGLNREQLNREF